MTGKELARAIRAAKGKIAVPMLLFNDVPYVFAEKADLIATFERIGEAESHMRIDPEGDHHMIVRDDS